MTLLVALLTAQCSVCLGNIVELLMFYCHFAINAGNCYLQNVKISQSCARTFVSKYFRCDIFGTMQYLYVIRTEYLLSNLQRKSQIFLGSDKYVGPPYRRAEVFAGRVACCPLVSHG